MKPATILHRIEAIKYVPRTPTVFDAAANVGVNPGTVFNGLESFGITDAQIKEARLLRRWPDSVEFKLRLLAGRARDEAKRLSPLDKHIIELYLQNGKGRLSLEKIGERCGGMSRQAICQRLQKIRDLGYRLKPREHGRRPEHDIKSCWKCRNLLDMAKRRPLITPAEIKREIGSDQWRHRGILKGLGKLPPYFAVLKTERIRRLVHLYNANPNRSPESLARTFSIIERNFRCELTWLCKRGVGYLLRPPLGNLAKEPFVCSCCGKRFRYAPGVQVIGVDTGAILCRKCDESK